MKKLLLAVLVLCCTATNVCAERVLTLYLMGTTLKADAYDATKAAWHRPELLAFMHYHQDGSQAMVQTQPYPLFIGRWVPEILVSNSHYKYVVNGAGTSPESNVFDLLSAFLGTADPNLGVRNWENIKLEALDAVNRVRNRHPAEEITLNLVGYSRGGISALQVARAVSQPGYGFVHKVNILDYDPVPGGGDPVGNFGSNFLLSSKVNQYVGLYAEHERSYQFEPVIPRLDPGNYATKMLMARVPGSHETMVGNRQIDGHSVTLSGPNLTPDAENQGFKYVQEVAQAVAEQLLSSYEWGSVPFYTTYSGIASKSDFSQRVTTMWSQDYQWIPFWAFGPAFGTYDICYVNLNRDHNLRAVSPLVVNNSSRLAFIGGMRHANEWVWTWPCFAPWPVYVNYFNAEQVYWLNNTVQRISGNTWDLLQSFRGNAPPDVTPPVADTNPLPDAQAACALTITKFPTATDNAIGVVVGNTLDPLTYLEQGSYTINWSYADQAGNTATQQQRVLVQDTEAPTPDQAELAAVTGECSAQIENTPTATDNCSDTIIATTTDPLSYGTQGSHTVTWWYRDANGNTATQAQPVTIKDTLPPVPDMADLPAVQGECSLHIEAAPTATDNCSGAITATTSDPLSYSEQGSYIIHWTYTDANGNTATQEQTVTIKDTLPPVIQKITATPKTLWPPNNKMAEVQINLRATDNCGKTSYRILAVSSNEPITQKDWRISQYNTVLLMAKRVGKQQSDRIYTITVEYVDAVGNISLGAVTVKVPHDNGRDGDHKRDEERKDRDKRGDREKER